jgi:hypothetical protein
LWAGPRGLAHDVSFRTASAIKCAAELGGRIVV